MQMIRFVSVGLINTLVGVICIYAGMWIFGFDYRVANIFGYSVGCVISFSLNRSWTFRYEGSYWGSALRWGAVVVICFALNLGVVIIVHERLHVQATLAQLAGVLCYTAASFVGGRFFAFRRRKERLIETPAS